MKQQNTSAGVERGSRADFIREAERLFAERGVNGVGIREIVASVGHKNVASVRYHFGTKENLIREIMIEGLRKSEQWRIDQLNALEKGGNEITIRDILLIVVGPVRHKIVTETFMLFLAQVSLSDHKFYDDVINSEIQVGMKRCVNYLRELSASGSEDIFDTRMSLLSLYATAFLNSQSWKRSKGGVMWRKSVNWRSSALLNHFLETAEAMLKPTRAPVL